MRYKNIVWVLITAFVLASCSTFQRLKSENGMIEGTIYSISNEPFTKLGLQTSNGTMYILKCSKEVEQVLNKKQGQKIKIYYEKTEQSPEGLTLLVQNIDKK